MKRLWMPVILLLSLLIKMPGCSKDGTISPDHLLKKNSCGGEYEYSNGKLKRIYEGPWTAGTDPVLFTEYFYSGNSLQYELNCGDRNNQGCLNFDTTYYFHNKAGKLIRTEGIRWTNSPITSDFIYNQAGFISTKIDSIKELNGYVIRTSEYSYDLIGNVNTISVKYVDGLEFLYGGPPSYFERYEFLWEIEYDDKPNPLNGYLIFAKPAGGYDESIMPYPFNNITRSQFVEFNNSSISSHSYSVSYEYDEDGFPVQFILFNDGDRSYCDLEYY